eukprot:TRINITY_DN9357_c0_g2_i3.p1 TRINITY_DN9357_c0_g2~~TRINITY_DN9357_c0_g2_i3.p1  ORF type:complete len:606 (-),score=87.30 TRINITY_DN9357_c0_g2_i3:177-1994(-)
MKTEHDKLELEMKAEMKMERLREIERLKMASLERRKKEAEFAKMERDERRKELDRKRSEESNKLAERLKLEEKALNEKKERSQAERQRDASERERQRKMKAEVLSRKIEELINQKREIEDLKLQQMAGKYDKLKQIQEENQRKKQLEMEQSKREFDEKLILIRKSNEERANWIRKKYEEKESKVNKKKEEMEEERRESVETKRTKSTLKLYEIHKNLEDMLRENERRQEEKRTADQNFSEKTQKRMKERDEKRRRRIETERMRHENVLKTYHSMEDELKSRNDDLLKNLETEINEKNTKRKELLEATKSRMLKEQLHCEEAIENSRRLERIRETKHDNLLMRISLDNERIQKLQRDRELAAVERHRIHQTLEKEKRLIIEGFERQRRNVLNHSLFSLRSRVDTESGALLEDLEFRSFAKSPSTRLPQITVSSRDTKLSKFTLAKAPNDETSSLSPDHLHSIIKNHKTKESRMKTDSSDVRESNCDQSVNNRLDTTNASRREPLRDYNPERLWEKVCRQNGIIKSKICGKRSRANNKIDNRIAYDVIGSLRRMHEELMDLKEERNYYKLFLQNKILGLSQSLNFSSTFMTEPMDFGSFRQPLRHLS